MKYSRLIWSVTKGLLLIGVAALILFQIREKFVLNLKLLAPGIFAFIVFGTIGAVFATITKIYLKEIKKIEEKNKECANLDESRTPRKANNFNSNHKLKHQTAQSNVINQGPDRQTFTYPRFFSSLIVIVSLVFFVMPYLGALPGKEIGMDAQVSIYLLALCILIFGLYCFRYLVVIDTNILIVRKFLTREYSLNNVRRIEVVEAGRFAGTIVLFSNGEKITIDPKLGNYKKLLEMLKNSTSCR